jgi:serine/threonine protein phosphatase 1
MIVALRKLLRPRPVISASAVPVGERVYAIGDIHGRSDLFIPLVEAIEADDRSREPADTTIVLLGDLVDRGPDSAGVISAARDLAARRKVRIIWGNHEEMFLRCFDDLELLRSFLRYGGRETVLSYPLDLAEWNAASHEEAQVLMRAAVPKDDLAFIRGFEDAVVIGDYLFVHAGIAPDIPIEEQSQGDLRWIREPFLSHRGNHGFVVVHGHTIALEPVIRANRIGIDTGAYVSGRLTALGLEGTDRWLIEACDHEGSVKTLSRAI